MASLVSVLRLPSPNSDSSSCAAAEAQRLPAQPPPLAPPHCTPASAQQQSDASRVVLSLRQRLIEGDQQDQARACSILAEFAAGPHAHVAALTFGNILPCIGELLQRDNASDASVGLTLSAASVIRNVVRSSDPAHVDHVVQCGGSAILSTLLSTDDAACEVALEAIESILRCGECSLESSPTATAAAASASPTTRRPAMKLYPEGWSAGAAAHSSPSTRKPRSSMTNCNITSMYHRMSSISSRQCSHQQASAISFQSRCCIDHHSHINALPPQQRRIAPRSPHTQSFPCYARRASARLHGSHD